jgi:hypothetical protein
VDPIYSTTLIILAVILGICFVALFVRYGTTTKSLTASLERQQQVEAGFRQNSRR